jgi:hypothetical protein
MSKASRSGPEFYKRKNETYRQYTLRIRDLGLYVDETAREGVLVWLDTYESVRFGGYELTENEFLATMKLVYFILMEMKIPGRKEYGLGPVTSQSSSSYSLASQSTESSNEDIPLSRVQSRVPDETESESVRSRVNVLRQMENILGATRRSLDLESFSSRIDHGSVFEQVIDREERERRMRGGRLGERQGSIIYYDVDD